MEPEDLKSYKIRVQDSDAYIHMIDMMGGIGIPMAQSEVYAAVQQHVIEGGENSEVVYNNFKHYEVSPYFCYTNHLVMTDVVVANKDFLEEMDPETREIFNTLIKESMEVEFAEWDKGIEAARQELASQGVTFVESDVKAFQQQCQPLLDSIANRSDMTRDVYLHPDSEAVPTETLALIRDLGKHPGIVINPGVSLESVRELFPLVDYVLVMTVNPGFAGRDYLPWVEAKIERLAALRPQYGFHIVIDGGVTRDILRRLWNKGVEGFVLGRQILFGQNRPYDAILREVRDLA